ncbi:hypothetical protein MUP00_02260 [Candidatus Bathyarchaeota archaeon]|nr:hypothetical protein [Candidatus Bathyarchaeota archaeon]
MAETRIQRFNIAGRVGILVSSGKAYYTLVTELKRRGIKYAPLLPSRPVPLDVGIIVASEGSASDAIQGRTVVAFREDSNSGRVVDEVVIRLLGKKRFKELAIGIDPGKQTGLAVLGDAVVLDTRTYTDQKSVVEDVASILTSFPFERSVVKIGDGAEEYGGRLRADLDSTLSGETEIQLVEESGTTSVGDSHRGEVFSGNIVSAIRIALREGKQIERGN